MINSKIIIHPEKIEVATKLYLLFRWTKEKNLDINRFLLMVIVECLAFEKEYLDEKIKRETEEPIQKFINWIKGNKEYDFKWKPPGHKGRAKKENITTIEYVIFISIYSYFLHKIKKNTVTKDEAIKFFFELLSDETMPKPIEGKKNKYTLYKKMVISGLLAEATGHKLSNKNSLTNEQVFQAVRNAVNKKAAK